ncbi:unnamed protein product [Ectocarpus sp. CCAP 1310/34]|nr:unnamed protein product [Ectocarpus sp. CCAP 1310/34]
MKQTSFLCLSGLAGSLAFVPSTNVVPSSAWTSRSSGWTNAAADAGSRRGVPVCMAATQPKPGPEVMGLNLGKPAPVETPEDYVYEQFIPDTPMTRKFGHLRGAKVKTVSETVADFYKYYKKVVLTQFRTIVTEYLQSTHLTVYDARFKYDPLFGVGFYTSFMRFMRAYPVPGQAELIFDAVVKAIGNGLDPDQMRKDTTALKEWAEGKTEEDVMEMIKSDDRSNIVTDGFYVARTGLGPFGEGWEEKGEDVDWFLYNRLWGVGVFTLMENIGLEPTEELLEKWFAVVGTSAAGAAKDLNLYQEQIGKIEQAELLFKEIEIREKKRLAERLEAKAQDAIKAAERAEQDAKNDAEEEERIKNAKEGDVLPNDLPKDN